MRENIPVQINRGDLSRHYASCSDAELLAIDPNELTELAQECYRDEMDRRQLTAESSSDNVAFELDEQDLPEPDWFDAAATVCSFQIGAGQRYAQDAERACTILDDAGIPSQAIHERGEGAEPGCIAITVPGALNLKASSVLDRDLFNEGLEETWRSHFEHLSDEQLHALEPDELCAGLLDRAARLKRAYEEVLASRTSGSTRPDRDR